MSKTLQTVATYTSIGAKAQRTIEHSPEFSGIQKSESGRPDRQIPPGGFMTG